MGGNLENNIGGDLNKIGGDPNKIGGDLNEIGGDQKLGLQFQLPPGVNGKMENHLFFADACVLLTQHSAKGAMYYSPGGILIFNFRNNEGGARGIENRKTCSTTNTHTHT